MTPSAVTIIVPVYNEARAVEGVMERLRTLLAELPAQSEVLFVDDGSTDGSAEVLEECASERVRVIHHPRNRGYGAALKTGIAHARHERIAIADADGTYPLERLPALIARMDDTGVAMVVGARSPRHQPAERRPAKAILRWLAQYLTGERIPDLNSGLRVFARDDARRLRRLLPDGFSFTTTLTMALLTEGRDVQFVPIPYRRRVGHSKIRPVRDTAGFLMLMCRTTLAFNPMKVFGPVGAGLVAVGAFLLVARMFVDQPFGVATTITFLIGGLQVLAIGLLADLVNRRGTGE